MTVEEFNSHIKDGILWNVKLRAGNNHPKTINYVCLLSVRTITYKSGNTHANGIAYFRNPYQNNELQEYHWYSVINDAKDIKDLVFELSQGVTPREFWPL